jgi:hypothetical protein
MKVSERIAAKARDIAALVKAPAKRSAEPVVLPFASVRERVRAVKRKAAPRERKARTRVDQAV